MLQKEIFMKNLNIKIVKFPFKFIVCKHDECGY